jgi:hypothetical protein
MGSALAVGLGVLPLREAPEAVGGRTLALLFGMMVLAASSASRSPRS